MWQANTHAAQNGGYVAGTYTYYQGSSSMVSNETIIVSFNADLIIKPDHKVTLDDGTSSVWASKDGYYTSNGTHFVSMQGAIQFFYLGTFD